MKKYMWRLLFKTVYKTINRESVSEVLKLSKYIIKLMFSFILIFFFKSLVFCIELKNNGYVNVWLLEILKNENITLNKV